MLLEPVLLEAALATIFDGVTLAFGTGIKCNVLAVDQIVLMKALNVGNMVAQSLIGAPVLHNLVLLS